MEESSVSVGMTSIGSLTLREELQTNKEGICLNLKSWAGRNLVTKTSPCLVHCGVLGKVLFSSVLQSQRKDFLVVITSPTTVSLL